MKTQLLILFALFSVASTASCWARLGETENAIIGRYGKAGYKMHNAWGDEEGFSANGFSIKVTFINGVSVGESYQLSPGHKFTDVLTTELLAANCQGFSWDELSKDQIPKTKDIYNPIRQMWRRPNLSTAILTDSCFEFKSIILILAQQDADNQKPAAPNTQGF